MRIHSLRDTNCCGWFWGVPHALGEALNFAARRAAGHCGYGTISSPDFFGWIGSHVARLALSPSDRAFGVRDHFRALSISCDPAPAPTGAPIYAAHRCGDARGDPHHSAARQPEGGARLRPVSWRMDRGTTQADARGGAVHARH